MSKHVSLLIGMWHVKPSMAARDSTSYMTQQQEQQQQPHQTEK
jgi:hypothetical protein